MMRTIILLHGAIGARDQLSLLSHELSQYGLNIFTFNFSGHGKVPFQAEFGIEVFASELEHFIKENQLEKPDVFGYSMGGYVALYLASEKPHLLGKISTLGTKFEWSPEISMKEIKMLDPAVITEKLPKFADALKERHGKEWQLVLQRTADMMIGLGNKNVLDQTRIASIENKVVLGLGDKDSMVSLDETVSVYRQLKNGSMFMLPDTKHPIEGVNVEILGKLISGIK